MPDWIYNALILAAAILGLAILWAEFARRRDRRRLEERLRVMAEQRKRFEARMRKAHATHPIGWGKDGAA